MAEAMAAGNAIIARNVGQTELFVKNNSNGLFIENDNEEGLANALLKLFNNNELINLMGINSADLIRSVHNFENFVQQIEIFWKSI